MSSPPGQLRVEPMQLRERPTAELEALFAGGWPAFIGADAIAHRELPVIRSAFPQFELVLLRDGVLAAAGWGVPIAWDATVADLPHGYSDTLVRAVTDRRRGDVPDTFVICAVQVSTSGARSGLAVALLRGLIEAAADAELTKVVAPLRPTVKHRYPLTPIEDYARWTRSDGSAFDPWVRTHLRMGAHIIGTHNDSQTFTGTVEQWQTWSGLDLPGDGTYVVRDALAPLQVDRSADRGVCTEPTIWVRHR